MPECPDELPAADLAAITVGSHPLDRPWRSIKRI